MERGPKALTLTLHSSPNLALRPQLNLNLGELRQQLYHHKEQYSIRTPCTGSIQSIPYRGQFAVHHQAMRKTAAERVAKSAKRAAKKIGEAAVVVGYLNDDGMIGGVFVSTRKSAVGVAYEFAR